ncbi:hypothetical protein, partial [Streptomyces sp. ISL-100]|uniref:hypothetical protein n=1 Tax=Streptomyces sp. ISL-100 TaxID=2819173 RepID=UPI001BE8944B
GGGGGGAGVGVGGGFGFGPAVQVALPATATAEPDDISLLGKMEAYEQLSAAAGTGLSSSQTKVVAANRRPGDGGCTFGIIVRADHRHAAVPLNSPDGWDFRGFAFEMAGRAAKVIGKFLRTR